ncbi:hypothetical protein EDD11_005795 [Mortierella claussenii]|nr:hypothetical protein EDD11_005795 [Mortierella claussenii]
MAVAPRKLYWITAGIFLLIVFLSYHKSSLGTSYAGTDQTNQQQQLDTTTGKNGAQRGGNSGTPYDGNGKDTSQKYDDNDSDDDDTDKSGLYGPGTGDNKNNGDDGADSDSVTPTNTAELDPTTPSTPGKYDTLVLIPSSWTQMQNRQWVRQTVFGIKDNLKPCRKMDGRIIYKFYIHGHSTWQKSNIHSAEYMQAQVRNLHVEFMEYNDHYFDNRTVTDRHAVWGDALAWAVGTFIPEEQIEVEKVLIFDSTTVVDLPKMEAAVKALGSNPQGFLYTWGEGIPFASMVSYNVAELVVKDRETIKKTHKLIDIFTAATLYFTNPNPTFKVYKGQAQLWASDVGQVSVTSQAVGQVYQLEDWTPIVQKLAIQPTPACVSDPNRIKNIALLTSSYIYVDMCMAEASLPSAENKRLYASKHGYDFVARAAEFAQEEFRGRRLVWGKIGAIQKVLPYYEWLFWMDMDAVVANMDQDLRDIIRQAEERSQTDEEISLIVAKPVRDKMLNAGVMLIKNTDWTRRFFNEVQTKVDWYSRSSYEQAAIWEVMNDPKWASGVYLFDKDDHTMNTFPKNYNEKDFIIHFAPASCPADPVMEALDKIKKGQSALGVGI